MSTVEPKTLLVGAGLATWALAGVPTLVDVVQRGLDARGAIWAACHATFAVAFCVATAVWSVRQSVRLVALGAQTLAALAVAACGRGGFESALFAVIAGQAPLLMPVRFALAWALAQSSALLLVLTARWGAGDAMVSTGTYAGFQLFALGAAHLAQREATAREELARVHAELLATQELFADSTRTAERLRISRELHDTLGHHLTALSLNLEVARNVADGRAAEPVLRAHALTKELLAELREVVGAMREDRPLDLPRALRTLVAGIPRPKIHLAVAAELEVDAALAHTLFRCVQEAITNAVRHARAENLWIFVRDRDGAIEVVARDDGRGTGLVSAGNGLSGLRERIEQIGGSFEIESRPGEGLTLRALVPPRAALS